MFILSYADKEIIVGAVRPEFAELLRPDFVIRVDLENPVETIGGGFTTTGQDCVPMSAIRFVPDFNS